MPVQPAFLPGQNMPSALLLGVLAVAVDIPYALIACVRKELGLRFQAHAAVLEQPEVVPAAIAEIKADYLPARFVSDYLGFLGVPLLLPGIAWALFFLGRSTGLSVTSIRTASK